MVDDIIDFNMTKNQYLDMVARKAREEAERTFNKDKKSWSFKEMVEEFISLHPVTSEEWEVYNGGEYTQEEVEENRNARDSFQGMVKAMEEKL